MAAETKGRTSPAGGVPAPLTLDDLTADLIWPRLLRAAALALNPARLGIAFFAVIALMVVASLARSIAGPDADLFGPRLSALAEFLDAVFSLNGRAAGQALYDMFVAAPLALLRAAPLATLTGALLAVVITALAGGAISRMAACEFSLGMTLPWPQGIAFALKRLSALLGAILGPIIIVWVIAALIALGGLLLRIPALNILAGLLYGLTLLIALFAALLMGAYALAKPLLIPAVACEGADAIDALQRGYAYVFAKPLRLTLYIAILAFEGALMLFVVGALVWGAATLSHHAAGAIAGDSGRDILALAHSPVPAADTDTTQNLGLTARPTAWLIRLWLGALWALWAGYALSFYFTASTLLYLAIRRVADGQDMNELWLGPPSPGGPGGSSPGTGGNGGAGAPAPTPTPTGAPSGLTAAATPEGSGIE